MKLEGCPYPTCNSWWCTSQQPAICPFAQEKVMETEFHFIAVAGNQNTSGRVKTREEAVKWATDMLHNKSSQNLVFIYSVVSVVERDYPPIKTRDIHPPDIKSIPIGRFD